MSFLTGKWKIILGMSMQFTWPFARGLAVAAAYIWPSWTTMLQVEERRKQSKGHSTMHLTILG